MMRDDVDRYIALHRATGFKFKQQAYVLHHFVRYAEARGEDAVCAQTAVNWANEAPSPGSRRDRLRTLWRFAQVMAVEDPSYEIPPEPVLALQVPRRRPHIFSVSQISRLLRAAAALGPRGSLRPKTYVTLFALLVATGLRISEALALRLDDLTADGLVVRQTKFCKSRLVPLHETARRGLESYLSARAKVAGATNSVFVSHRGTALPYSTAITTFLTLTRKLGLHPGPGHPGPRLHDLRHTFAVRSLERCGTGRDAVRRHMLALSTYLGHAHVADTYWYLQVSPQLLLAIAEASEGLAEGGSR